MKTPPGWRQAPPLIPGVAALRRDGRELMALALAVAGPLARAIALPASRPEMVFFVTTVASLLMGRCRNRWIVRLALAYGGSTAFGLGQRDGHTIPSELARSAWREGTALDVVNRGVPGHTHWTEADRFAWDLSVEPAPDMVLFYDGVNEFWASAFLNESEANHDWNAIEPNIELVMRSQRPSGPPPPAPPTDRVVTPDLVPNRTFADIGRETGTRYLRSTLMSEATAKARDIPIMWLWQPTRASRPIIPTEPDIDKAQEFALREQYGAAREVLTPRIIDLTDVFGSDRQPYFWDEVHHDEDAAAIIGRAMFERLRPTLQQIQDTGPRRHK